MFVFSSKVVTVYWLLACINAKRVVDAKDFVYRLDSDTIPNDRTPEIRTEAEATTHRNEPNLRGARVFQELLFALFGFSKARTSELQKIIAGAGGSTVVDDHSNYVTYLVVSLNSFDFKDVRFKYSEMVNDLYVVSTGHHLCTHEMLWHFLFCLNHYSKTV